MQQENLIHFAFSRPVLGALTLNRGNNSTVVGLDQLVWGSFLGTFEDWEKTWFSYEASLPWNSVPDETRKHTHSFFEKLRGCKGRKSVLWIGPSLNEQLFAVWLIKLWGILRYDLDRLRVHHYSNYAFRYSMPISRLNEVAAADFFLDQGKLTTFSLSEIRFYRTVWEALNSGTPDLFIKLRKNKDNTEIRYRLELLLDFFPDVTSGLSQWDKRLLFSLREVGARDGTKTPNAMQVVGYFMGKWGFHFGLPDAKWIAYRLKTLGSPDLKEPVLRLSGRTLNRATKVQLTPFGKSVLDAKRSYLEHNSHDNRVCAMQVATRAGIWCNQNGELRTIQHRQTIANQRSTACSYFRGS